jgi:hypothetical protein
MTAISIKPETAHLVFDLATLLPLPPPNTMGNIITASANFAKYFAGV